MSHTIELSEKTERVIAAAAAQQGMSFEEFVRRVLEALIAYAGEEKPAPESDMVLGSIRLQVKYPRSFGNADEREQERAYYEMEDWFRHVGATEEDIKEARRLSDELFPPDDEGGNAPAAVDHADAR